MHDDASKLDRGTPGAVPARDLNDLYILAQVADLGGFSAAARALNLSKSHLSRRVAALEARLGLRLLQRSTRRLVPTEAGERYLAYCRAIAETAHEADQAMLDLLAEPTGPVTLASPIGLAQAVLPLILPGFMLAYPSVTVRVHLSNDVADLYRDRIDIALRVREVIDEEANVIARRFGTSELSLVAARSYLQAHGTPASPAELAAHATVGWNAGQTGFDAWRLYDRQGQAVDVVHQPRLISGDLQLLLEALKTGAGIGLMPDPLWRMADTEDRLVQILTDWRTPEGIVYGAYASRRGMSPAVRVLIDYLGEHLTPLLDHARDKTTPLSPLHSAVTRALQD
ncbi:LysR family transcriptional regulator [Verticiella sediminum]|nr:LysR family transcriptional regulator [Verticiella sediminum]